MESIHSCHNSGSSKFKERSPVAIKLNFIIKLSWPISDTKALSNLLPNRWVAPSLEGASNMHCMCKVCTGQWRLTRVTYCRAVALEGLPAVVLTGGPLRGSPGRRCTHASLALPVTDNTVSLRPESDSLVWVPGPPLWRAQPAAKYVTRSHLAWGR